jgi:hypothetical protein
MRRTTFYMSHGTRNPPAGAREKRGTPSARLAAEDDQLVGSGCGVPTGLWGCGPCPQEQVQFLASGRVLPTA